MQSQQASVWTANRSAAKRSLRVATAAITSALCIFGFVDGAEAACQAPPSKPKSIARVVYPGTESILFCFGPVTVRPGQNTISFTPTDLVPNRPGWITRFDPDLVYADPTRGYRGVPGVDVIHLHHANWAVNDSPRWSAGEEKTIYQLPRGFGWRSKPDDKVVINQMIHNQYPTTEQVYITWRVDFVPDGTPQADQIKPVRTSFLEVTGFKTLYTVFDAVQGMGSNGRYTFPDQATTAERERWAKDNTVTVTRPMTLVQAITHLHPGGLSVHLKVKRGSATRNLFTGTAKYFEPAGAVSWDASLTVSKPSWRVKLNPGDKLTINATYDVSKASWYEAMGLMPIVVYDGTDAGGVDPFKALPPQLGVITHGHLAENSNHGGKRVTLNDPTRLLNGGLKTGGAVSIKDFAYELGDLSFSGSTARPPTVKQGKSLVFDNADSTGDPATDFIFHTITSCRNPCNRATGIAYPVANGPVAFDSGELGFGPTGLTPAANTKTWSTPPNLTPGTYSYFCRVHPFMRGAFRVVPN